MINFLGQAFNFDLLQANWDVDQYRAVIAEHLAEARHTGTSSTWVLSSHDAVRHPTRYGLPRDGAGISETSKAWLASNGTKPQLDRDRGLQRARAATLLLLALPGSAYLYQGEELGLHEVGELPTEVLQDPVFKRAGGAEKGRDGCRCRFRGPSTGHRSASARRRPPATTGMVPVLRRAGTGGRSPIHPAVLPAGARPA